MDQLGGGNVFYHTFTTFVFTNIRSFKKGLKMLIFGLQRQILIQKEMFLLNFKFF